MTIYHKHHIIPRHMGGTDDPENLVEVTVEEHAEKHRVLYEEHGRWQDRIAWMTLSGQITKAEAIKEIQRRPRSEETKQKMRKPKSESHRKNMMKPCPPETAKKISEAKKGHKAKGKQLEALLRQAQMNKTKLTTPEFREKMRLINLENWRKRKEKELGIKP
jgi:ABC-type glutathione transport system ATPase component